MKRPTTNTPSTDSNSYFDIDMTFNWSKYIDDLEKYINYLEAKQTSISCIHEYISVIEYSTHPYGDDVEYMQCKHCGHKTDIKIR